MNSTVGTKDLSAKAAARDATTRQPTIWVEVDDLLRYFDGSLTPTGIGRVQAEIFPHLARRNGGRIRFFRLGNDAGTLSLLSYGDVMRLADGDAFLSRHRARPWLLPARKALRYAARRSLAGLASLRAAGDVRRFGETVRPGDVILNIGASWTHHHFGRSVGELKARHGLRFALMVHDLLPATHPQYVSPSHVPGFLKWFHAMAEVADLVLTPSRSSAVACAGWLEAEGYAPRPIATVPFGAGFPSSAGLRQLPDAADRAHVLYVSTIEVRKNHMLLVRIWKKLIADHGADKVPPLMFAGKYGWEIDELKAELAATRFLDGKVKVAQDLTDGELAGLYKSALFTVFPSLCEGWGLPVAESLHYGRYCIASSATSIPEVGGRFVDYHDPCDEAEAHRLVERALFEPGVVAAAEQRIRDKFRAPGWDGTADAIVAAVDHHLGEAAMVGDGSQGLLSAGAIRRP